MSVTMRMLGWLNLSGAAFCALHAIHGTAFDLHAWLCAVNIVCAGINFECARSNAEAHGRAVARTVQPLVGSLDGDK